MTKKTEEKIAHESLAMALAAAQGEMTNPTKNCQNTHFKNRYADLSSVLAAVRPVLARHGIACVQSIDADGASVTVSTRLFWGQEVMDCGSLTQSIQGARNASQAIGAAVTYARRYSISAVCGIASDDDDDANALDGTPPARVEAAPRRESAKEREGRLRAEQVEAVRKLLRGPCGCSTKEDVVMVIHWATGGQYSYESMTKTDEGPGDVLAALNELNETGVPFDRMLGEAASHAREEATR